MNTDKFPGIVDAKIVQPRDVRVAIVNRRPSRIYGNMDVADVTVNGVLIRGGIDMGLAQRLYKNIIAGLEAEG